MLKIRLMGTEDELEEFKGYLVEEQSSYEVRQISRRYKSKGSRKHLRMYAEIEKNNEDKENDTDE